MNDYNNLEQSMKLLKNFRYIWEQNFRYNNIFNFLKIISIEYRLK